MKRNLLLLLLCSIPLNLFAQSAADDKKRMEEQYLRNIQSAHPLPTNSKSTPKAYWSKKYKNTLPPYMMAVKPVLPRFLNVNTIEDLEPNLQAQNESSIAVNPKNPKNIIGSAVDYRSNSATWVYVSKDGGKTWKNHNLGYALPQWRSSNDPSVAFDKDGTGYLVYGGFPDANQVPQSMLGSNGVFLSRTTDGGDTWEKHIQVKLHYGNQTLDSAFEDKYYIEVDNSDKSPYRGHLYIPWKRVTSRDSATQIVVTKSTDKGSTWSEPIPISPRKTGSSEDTTFGQSFPLTTTGPNGEVYAVWNDGIVHGVGFNRSFDGGKTWEEPRIIHNYNIFGKTKFLAGQGYRHTVKGVVRAEAYPVVKCDENNGNLYLCWAADEVPNIYFSKSTDKGQTWTNPKIVHSDLTNDQFWTWMAIDPTNGDLAIMYMDSRNDPENHLVQCYVSYSDDDGETWTDRLASDEAWDLSVNPFNKNFAGDYSGMDFYNGIIYPSWVDMRNTDENGTADSDVYTAIMHVHSVSPPDKFTSITIPEKPKLINLTWEPVYETNFGKKLNPSEIAFELYRNGEKIADLGGDIKKYDDDNLTPFAEYLYEIRATTKSDTSILVKTKAYPGGAYKPNPPVLSKIEYDLFQTKFIYQIPSFRADNITPITNLKKLEIYADNQKVLELPLSTLDTGKTKEWEIELPERGYYQFKSRIICQYEDESIGVQESDFTQIDTAFVGDREKVGFDENFENAHNKRYLRTKNFVYTDEIAYEGQKSLTNAEKKNYAANQQDTIVFYPIKVDFPLSGSSAIYFMDIATIGQIADKDTAYFEYSIDGMKTWKEAKRFNRSGVNSWQDEVLEQSDWQKWTVPIEITGDEVAENLLFIRVRFLSKFFSKGLGLYIDEINTFPKSSVESELEEAMLIYPNPANTILRVNLPEKNAVDVPRIEVFDMMGNEINIKNITINQNELSLNVSSIMQGVYNIRIVVGSHILNNRFTIVR